MIYFPIGSAWPGLIAFHSVKTKSQQCNNCSLTVVSEEHIFGMCQNCDLVTVLLISSAPMTRLVCRVWIFVVSLMPQEKDSTLQSLIYFISKNGILNLKKIGSMSWLGFLCLSLVDKVVKRLLFKSIQIWN